MAMPIYATALLRQAGHACPTRKEAGELGRTKPSNSHLEPTAPFEAIAPFLQGYLMCGKRAQAGERDCTSPSTSLLGLAPAFEVSAAFDATAFLLQAGYPCSTRKETGE